MAFSDDSTVKWWANTDMTAEGHTFLRSKNSADVHNPDPIVLSRHSGMTLSGIHSVLFLDSGQKRAGMTKG